MLAAGAVAHAANEMGTAHAAPWSTYPSRSLPPQVAQLLDDVKAGRPISASSPSKKHGAPTHFSSTASAQGCCYWLLPFSDVVAPPPVNFWPLMGRSGLAEAGEAAALRQPTFLPM